MSGQLRDDLYRDLMEWETTADVCLALGTSLAGMNADRLAVACGTAYNEHGRGQGLIIIGVQQTQGDKHAALRIFGKLDHVFSLLAEELGLPSAPAAASAPAPGDGGPGRPFVVTPTGVDKDAYERSVFTVP